MLCDGDVLQNIIKLKLYSETLIMMERPLLSCQTLNYNLYWNLLKYGPFVYNCKHKNRKECPEKS